MAKKQPSLCIIWGRFPYFALVTIPFEEVTMKDNESRVHVEHFFNIDSFENSSYLILAHLLLCGIHHFFKDPKIVVSELIREFWRTAKVYWIKDIGRYFVGRVLGIQVKLLVKTIAQVIGYESHETKFMNSWGDEQLFVRT